MTESKVGSYAGGHNASIPHTNETTSEPPQPRMAP